MSTKIYNARRLKLGIDLWDFVHRVRAHAEKNIQATLRNFYESTAARTMRGAARKEMLELMEEDPKHRGPITPFMTSAWVSKEFHAQASRYQKDFFGMDVAITFRQHKGRFYIIWFANGMMHNVLNFLRTDRQSVDFHYQNQSDKSARCSDEEWKGRGKLWDEMIDPDTHWWDMLVLDIFSHTNFYRLDPALKMMQENAKKKAAQKRKP